MIHLYNRANIGFSALQQHLCKCIWHNEKHSDAHNIPEAWQQAQLCQPLALTSLRIEKEAQSLRMEVASGSGDGEVE